MGAFNDNFASKNKKVRDFVKLHFHTSLEFYDDLEIEDKRKYFVHIKRSSNPLSPNMWYIQCEYKRYEYSFEEIAFVLNLTKQEVINNYVNAMKKLKFLVNRIADIK
ncbi:hypothetical protein [Helicobacter apodemus]|uniref:Uncharacterized protein n=1 Tax=Helicobacter apodemus TaxID=135569 RepID=A0A2U8FD24_9HELI|nr:hypothetical protein [Helicobacter apodemus]AWI34151.1 hypothetical protein CDV25_04760 [Helicobacter apodemus]